MPDKPLIVRMTLAKDWFEAFQMVWIASFERAAREMWMPCTGVSIEVGTPPADWKERRAPCRRFARRFAEDHGDWSMGGAWTMLAINPSVLPPVRAGEDDVLFGIALVGLASEIAARPELLDDEALAKAVFGWRFLEALGRLAHQAGENDPIAITRAIGAPITIDRDETFKWAAKWAECR